jgi:hypothetical protein
MTALTTELLRGDVAPTPQRTHPQRDWNAPYNKSVMDAAISAWQAQQSYVPDARPKTMEDHCLKHNVPFRTFERRFAQADPYEVPKRGREYLGGLSQKDHANIAASIGARDHFQKARSPSANISAIHKSVLPGFTRKQVSNSYHHSIKKAGSFLGTLATQGSTKDRRGAITAANQTHYYHTITSAWEFAEKNSPPERAPDGTVTAKWHDSAEHFIGNLDEACAIANLAPGKVVVDKRKPGKHNQNTSSSRVSITSVHLGFAGGGIGGSMYLMQGAAMPAYMNETFANSTWLEQCGAPRNSFCVMTEGAYMTNEVWDRVATRLAANIRDMVEIRDHPTWWVVLHLDGYKSHVMTQKVRDLARRTRF